ncbi:MAG: hypothetical protein HFJ29_04965 [Clostridia bacterium]|nr:hypothetical protein [Clostridia bacterium]
MINIENKKRKYYILMVLLLATLAVFILPNLIVSSIQGVTQNVAKQLGQNQNKYTIKVNTSSNFTSTDSPGIFEVLQTHLDGIAFDPNKALYCIEHGAAVGREAGTIPFSVAQQYGYINSPGLEIYWGVSQMGSWYNEPMWQMITNVYQSPYRTYPLLECTGNHHSVLQQGGNYYPEVGYIVTYPEMKEVTMAKKVAVWFTEWNRGIDPTGSENGYSEGKALYDEAVLYKEFHDKITDNGQNIGNGNNPDIKVVDETDQDKLTVKVDQNATTMTIGPYSIDYINGVYGNDDLAFGGISDMYMVGYNQEGKKIKDRIEIKEYIDSNNQKKKLEFFEPNESDKSYIDKTKQVYPKGKSAGEDEFYIVIDDPNAGSTDPTDVVSYIFLHVEFKWMAVTKTNVCDMEGYVYQINFREEQQPQFSPFPPYPLPPWGGPPAMSIEAHGFSSLTKIHIQAHGNVLEGERTLYQADLNIGTDVPPPPEPDIIPDVIDINVYKNSLIILPMQLGGYVWEDVPSGKENLADGKKNDNDRMLPNIKVTLYTEDGEVAKLMKDPNEQGLSDEEVMTRVNPTYTNEAGYYLFDGLDPMKKYYVEFEYNGQVYLPTDYERNLGVYNQQPWEVTSKGTESPDDRDGYDQNFAEIGSAPANYQVPSGSIQIAPLKGGYNESFSQYDLMGFKMTESGDYTEETRLIDSFYKIEGGEIKETDELQEGEISKKIKEYIKTNKKSPEKDDIISIYQQIAGGDEELLKKLQFIQDTYIKSYTQAQGADHDLYPIYDAFIVNNKEEEQIQIEGSSLMLNYNNVQSSTIAGVFYQPIYPGQYFINQGLWRRQEVDMALRKDILYAATRINGKTEVYEYNKREQLSDAQKEELRQLRLKYEQGGRKPADYQAYLKRKAEIEQENAQNGTGGYWQIQLRMRDYNNYYDGNYTRELYEADYNYRSDSTNKAGKDKELQLYVTYKITVRNASESILGEITEIVDFYDKDYEFKENLSWVMYKGDSNSNDLEEISFTESDYYDSIDNLSLQGNIKNKGKEVKSADSSQYESRSSECKSDMTGEYNDVYVKGLEGKKLASGEEAYIYLTFQVRKDGDKPVIVDDDNSLKENYVEINGYKTYYKDGTSLPNGVSKGSSDAAGLIDINSTPGNLCSEDLQGNKYEKNFENDTDRAKSIKVAVDNSFIRSINGNVWEDKRTQNVSNAIIGDGMRQDGEIGISGVTVELIERLEDGNEYVWQQVETNNGKYEFKTDDTGNFIIPGNYYIKFTYGDSQATVNTTANGGKNATSYNGQDFKSTVYQKDMNSGEEIKEYTGEQVDGYTGEYYDVKEIDELSLSGKNFSDAKDDWTRRQEIINYSKDKVTNQKAEILASPYTDGNTSELISNTSMTAKTGLMVLQGEYNRTSTDGDADVSNGADVYKYDNDKNGNYTVNHVDLGLVERPKAQLELSKKITNVKITLANGNILFDANDQMTDLQWTLKAKEYELKNKMKGNKYEDYYGSNHRYAYRTDVDNLVASTYDAVTGNNGLIVATMDEELMQGANIRISYELKVTNVGETDYEGEDFYYKGTGAGTIVTTKADTVTDYVANNLTFKEENNVGTEWQKVENAITTLGLNNSIATNIAKYNDVISTSKLGATLAPGQDVKVGLVLTQLINPENSSDDKTYDNIAEITSISNTVGRRMAFSIQGNQDPTELPKEVDAVKSERVTILPPFGSGNTIVYIAIAATVLVILTVGIIFIKKKVLSKE